nr:hypothetical protein [uncultured Lichenicoccus sp.]
MTRLTSCLVLITVLFWAGHLLIYFRKMIIEWIDNRIHYEPAVARIRLLLRRGQR